MTARTLLPRAAGFVRVGFATTRTLPPRAAAIVRVVPNAVVHFARVEPDTGRILSVCSAAALAMPPELRAQLGMQIIHADWARDFHNDPQDRVLTATGIGKTGKRDLVLTFEARQQRNEMLAATDRLMLVDTPVASGKVAGWRAYRQALRDLTKQADFPHTITWPTPPT